MRAGPALWWKIFGAVSALLGLFIVVVAVPAAAKDIKKYVSKPIAVNRPAAAIRGRSGGVRTARPSGGGHVSRPSGGMRPSGRPSGGSTHAGRPSIPHGSIKSGGAGHLTAGPGLRGPATIAPYNAGGITPHNAGGITPHNATIITPNSGGKIIPGGGGAALPKGASHLAVINGGNFPVTRDRRRIFIRGVARSFVPVAGLAAFYVGGRQLYPYGYVSLPQPICTGVSDNGCALNWQPVELEDGGTEMQCVEFCPQGISAAAAIAFASAPAASAGRCEVVLFSDAKFSGLSAPTHENQPRLVDLGWKDEIASVQIKSGTWDFYADDDYGGDVIRLAPGPYETLGEQWTKRIGSMMCVNPDPPAARLAALPAVKGAGCELVLYSESNLAGVAAPTGEDQARLAEVGWKYEIASVEVKAGTWDVFADDDYRGETRRLVPGRYPDLAEKWTRKISSFKCAANQTQ